MHHAVLKIMIDFNTLKHDKHILNCFLTMTVLKLSNFIFNRG